MCIGVGLFIFLNENHELSPPLEVNAEIAAFVQMIVEKIQDINRNSFSIFVALTNLLEQDIFIHGDYFFDYFDGRDWFVIPTDRIDSNDKRLISAGVTEIMGYNFDAPRESADLFRL